MTPAKRAFDVAFALVLAGLFAFPLAVLLIVLWASEGRPLFHVAERMHSPEVSFRLWKLRTMRVAPADSGVSGGDKAARISPMGRFLRRSRLDEVPQLWNVLRGDMSFVGPRPPLRAYVERFPALYARVLRNRPGLTGLATLHYHAHEERLLATCTTPEDTDRVYAARCVPRKARLDLIYQDRQTFCLDLVLLGQTAGRVLFRPFRRRP